MRDELVPFFDTNYFFQETEERITFFIRDRRKGIIRILAFKVNNHLCKLVVGTEVLDGIFKCFPANDGREITLRLAMDCGCETTLRINGPPLVEPEVLPEQVSVLSVAMQIL